VDSAECYLQGPARRAIASNASTNNLRQPISTLSVGRLICYIIETNMDGLRTISLPSKRNILD